MDQRHWQEALSSHTKLISCFWSAVCVCVSQFSLSYLTYIQHATTVFTQPALSGFTIQASIFGSLDTQVSAFCSLVPRPHSTMHYAVCAPFSFNFGFQKKKEKKSLVAWSFFK